MGQLVIQVGIADNGCVEFAVGEKGIAALAVLVGAEGQRIAEDLTERLRAEYVLPMQQISLFALAAAVLVVASGAKPKVSR